MMTTTLRNLVFMLFSMAITIIFQDTGRFAGGRI